MNALFWLAWLVELIYCLVVAGHLMQQYAQSEFTPVNPHVVLSAWRGIVISGIFVAGGLVLRYGFDLPRPATWFVVLPLAAYVVFFLGTAIFALVRGGFQ